MINPCGCDGQYGIDVVNYEDGYWIYCKDCGRKASEVKDTKVEAVELWNEEKRAVTGTRYILQLDVMISESSPDANTRKVFSLLGDSFNYSHDLFVLAKQPTVFEFE